MTCEEHDYYDGDTILGINKFQASYPWGHDIQDFVNGFDVFQFQPTCPSRVRHQFLLSQVTPEGREAVSTVTS